MRGSGSHLSEVLARLAFGVPEGYTFCGYLGSMPRLEVLTKPLDWLMQEPEHCYNAMLRSINRLNME